MSENTNFMNFENLNKLIEEHRKETIPYKNYEFDNTSYTLLLININNLLKENQKLENQQKEFIDYLENEIKERNIQIAGYHTTTQLLIEQIIETEKKVLSKYKEIIGDDK